MIMNNAGYTFNDFQIKHITKKVHEENQIQA